MESVVADAGPLFGLARVGKLHLLQKLYSFVLIPQKVYEEITRASNKPGAKAISKAVLAGWIEVIYVENQQNVDKLNVLIDKGESEAIQLIKEQKLRTLIIDERKGRKIAKARGIHVIGTGTILIKAKKAGLLKEVSVVLHDLRKTGYRLSPALCKRILELAGEN
jgi:predicted nucleic acid-binding protein